MRILICDGTGLVGTALCYLLARDHDVIALNRNPQRPIDNLPANVQVIDSHDVAACARLITPQTVIINLAGVDSFAALHAGTHHDMLLQPGYILREAVEQAGIQPYMIMQGSSIGCYGDGEDDLIIELTPPGDCWQAQACADWERSTADIAAHMVVLRFGMILNKHGGLLPAMMANIQEHAVQPARENQWISWVHYIDAAFAVAFLLANEAEAEGVYNIVAPYPEKNGHFMQTLAEISADHPAFDAPAPGLMWADDPLLEQQSQRVIPHRLLEMGFSFRFPSFEDAIRHIMYCDH